MKTKWEITKEKATAKILAAATIEFAEKGYNGAIIRSIATRAGVANGLVLKYFDTKEKLLSAVIMDYRPEVIYAGVNETDPYNILCIYLDHIRKLQRENPVQFRLHTSIINNVDFPESIHDAVKEGFEGSVLEDAIRRAQEAGELVQGDAYKIFRILAGAVYGLLSRYEAIGTIPPDNDALLNILGYSRIKKIYKQQNERMKAMENDLRMLMASIRETYPLSISINLSRNTYRMIDYDNYSTHMAPAEGCFDDLIAVGAATVPKETDRKKFLKLFERRSLIEGFNQGERQRILLHSQTGDDGVNRWIETRCKMKKNDAGDIVAIAIGGIVDEETVKRDSTDVYEEISPKTAR